jgi:hypothetical protein
MGPLWPALAIPHVRFCTHSKESKAASLAALSSPRHHRQPSRTTADVSRTGSTASGAARLQRRQVARLKFLRARETLIRISGGGAVDESPRKETNVALKHSWAAYGPAEGPKCLQLNNAKRMRRITKFSEMIQRIRPVDPMCFWAFHVAGQRLRTNLRALRSS